jgi:hypothetical protein
MQQLHLGNATICIVSELAKETWRNLVAIDGFRIRLCRTHIKIKPLNAPERGINKGIAG